MRGIRHNPRVTGRTASFAALAALAVAGCGEVPIRESELESTLPQRTAPLVVGQSDRGDVRQALGQPWLASEYWRFDAFRMTDANKAVMVIMLVPVWIESDDLEGHVLVDYDERGTVAAVEHAFANDADAANGALSASAQVRAGDARLWASVQRDSSFVAVSGARRDAYLRDHPPRERCRLLVGCLNDACPVSIRVDGKPVLALPDDATRFLPAVAPFELPPGEHRLEIAPTHWYLSFAAQADFACAVGATVYATIAFGTEEPRAKGGLQRKLPVRLDVAAEMPAAFSEPPLIVYANGRWLVPREPGGPRASLPGQSERSAP